MLKRFVFPSYVSSYLLVKLALLRPSCVRVSSPSAVVAPACYSRGRRQGDGRMADDGLLEAVRGLHLAHPELGPKPLLAKLRE